MASPKWKATLMRMGFPDEQVQLASRKCTTLHRAVEWICTQDAQPIGESIGSRGSALRAESPQQSMRKRPAAKTDHVENLQGRAESPKQSMQKRPAAKLDHAEKLQMLDEQADVKAVDNPGTHGATNATHLRWKSNLSEMGFDPTRIEDALNTGLCTTLRRAVEWLCSQEDDAVGAPVDQPIEVSTNEASLLQREGNAKPELQLAESNILDEGNDSVLSSDAQTQRMLHQPKQPSSIDELSKPLTGLVSEKIAPLQMKKLVTDASAGEVSSSSIAFQFVSPQRKRQFVDKTQPKSCETVQPTCEDLPKRHFSTISSNSGPCIRPSPGSASRRTSLGSLLAVPAETWSADQLQAALRQLHSFGSQRPKPSGSDPTRKRLRFKQSLHAHGAPRTKRTRLYFKQSSSAYPARVPSARLDESSIALDLLEAPLGNKVPKAFAKWSAVLLDMGFPADQIDSKLRKYKSLNKAIDVLCS